MALLWRDVNLDAATIRIKRTLPDALVFANPEVARGMSKDWELVVKELRIGATFHALRHTCFDPHRR